MSIRRASDARIPHPLETHLDAGVQRVAIRFDKGDQAPLDAPEREVEAAGAVPSDSIPAGSRGRLIR